MADPGFLSGVDLRSGKQRCFSGSRRIENRLQNIGRRSLPLCSGDSGHKHPASGIPVKPPGSHGDCLSNIGYQDLRKLHSVILFCHVKNRSAFLRHLQIFFFKGKSLADKKGPRFCILGVGGKGGRSQTPRPLIRQEQQMFLCKKIQQFLYVSHRYYFLFPVSALCISFTEPVFGICLPACSSGFLPV